MDREWVLNYLNESLDLLNVADSYTLPDHAREIGAYDFNRRLIHLRTVLNTVADGLGAKVVSYRDATADKTRTAITQAIYALEDGAEVMKRLGPAPGPTLRADSLHPLVWDAAKSFWRSHHRRAAVDAAAKSVNAAMQDRLGRRDTSEKSLVEQAFTTDEPKPGKPRLRLAPDDGSPTYKSLQDGARSFGVGCFMALRNPSAHASFDDELPEQEALEQLAAFSVLARWVEAAEVVTAPDDH